MPTMQLPIVSTCSISGCSYNHDQDCHAGAITVLGDTGCGTYVAEGRGAGTEGRAQVGACHRSACTHNENLECAAPKVEIGAGGDTADCLTFTAA
ncbi:DUF1540 domain-containing protein [Nocardioidaceae bacterium]|nr:DUF1540 domain-containing protein [Nocardioidaceae bacterium]